VSEPSSSFPVKRFFHQKLLTVARCRATRIVRGYLSGPWAYQGNLQRLIEPFFFLTRAVPT